MQVFRGDTIEFDFNATLGDGSNYTFQEGDLLKVGVKEKTSKPKYLLYKQINIQEQTDKVTIVFDHDEVKNLCKGDKIIEIELTNPTGRVSTLYQDKITILEDIINE